MGDPDHPRGYPSPEGPLGPLCISRTETLNLLKLAVHQGVHHRKPRKSQGKLVDNVPQLPEFKEIVVLMVPSVAFVKRLNARGADKQRQSAAGLS